MTGYRHIDRLAVDRSSSAIIDRAIANEGARFIAECIAELETYGPGSKGNAADRPMRNERARKILRYRYGLDGHPQLTQKVIGELPEFDMRGARVSFIEKDAKKALATLITRKLAPPPPESTLSEEPRTQGQHSLAARISRTQGLTKPSPERS